MNHRTWEEDMAHESGDTNCRTPTDGGVRRLLQLAGRIEALPDFAEVVESLQAGHAATLDGVWGSSCAPDGGRAGSQSAPAVLVIVCPRLDEVQGLIGDLSIFSAPGAGAVSRHESLSGRADGAGRGGRRSRPRAQVAAGTASAEGAGDEHPGLVAAGAQPRAAGPADPHAADGRAACVGRNRLVAGHAAATRTRRRWNCPASSPAAAGSSISSLPTGSSRCGSSCSATRSNRSGRSRWRASGATSGWRRLM